MRHWAAVVPAEQFARERLYASSCVRLDAGSTVSGPAVGELVALIGAVEPAVLFGLGVVVEAGTGLRVKYRRRLFDTPVEVGPGWAIGVGELTAAAYRQLTALVPVEPRAAVSRWLVSVSLPIEATSPAEAVREFWSYVDALGPGELPAFVSPAADELALQAYVLGAETDLDPEDN